MNSIELNLFSSRLASICDEMGAILRCASFSTNIKDRLDYSCAVFAVNGDLCAQAAHIPVHLGSMAFAMRDLVKSMQWAAGDMVVLNDPYLGGTHLPDVTLIAPVFVENCLMGFVVNRAHHADIGSDTPGSMPVSQTLADEGMVIAPSYLVRTDQVQQQLLQSLLDGAANPEHLKGDFAAQMSANRIGVERLTLLIKTMSIEFYQEALIELNDYADRLSKSVFRQIKDGEYCFTDYLDDDGFATYGIKICVSIVVENHFITLDFSGTDPQVDGNVNCPESVVAAAVYYVFRCLMPTYTPACAGAFRSLKLIVPKGCVLNAEYPHAVVAGNVETSTRVTDVVLGALAEVLPLQIPAASHGSMNNVAMGQRSEKENWDYYETIGGGMGAHSNGRGFSAIQTHMTNTRNTPIEVLESIFPLRIKRYAIRKNSGGQGQHAGGDGIVREYEFLADASVSLLTERREYAPWGLQGGADGRCGINRFNGKKIAAKVQIDAKRGDTLCIETPGGGGWGAVIS